VSAAIFAPTRNHRNYRVQNMPIDRCYMARQIIQSCLRGGDERITGDRPEEGGVYLVTACVPSLERAGELSDSVGATLVDAGFDLDYAREGDTRKLRDEHGFALVFRVDVRGIRQP